MSELIEKEKELSDALHGGTSRITNNLKEIIKAITLNKHNVIIELPWEAEIDGNYHDSIIVVAVKATKKDFYYLNPLNTEEKAFIVKSGDEKKGPPRKVGKNSVECLPMVELLKLAKNKGVWGLIRED